MIISYNPSHNPRQNRNDNRSHNIVTILAIILVIILVKIPSHNLSLILVIIIEAYEIVLALGTVDFKVLSTSDADRPKGNKISLET